jgi:hypothetical protein
MCGHPSRLAAVLLLTALCAAAGAASPTTRPRVAVFPIAGSAAPSLRQQLAFALRSKLERGGQYDVLDGAIMDELAAAGPRPLNLATAPAALVELGQLVRASIFVWGEANTRDGTTQIDLRLLDTRQSNASPQAITQTLRQPTDMRFVVEAVAEHLPNVAFDRPVEQSVWDDATAQRLWAEGPNLVYNGDFGKPGQWLLLYQSRREVIQHAAGPPAPDNAAMIPHPEASGRRVLAMNLSRTAAENNGLACVSDPIEVATGMRYRLAFRYRSDGPALHVFVKGYAMVAAADGTRTEREVYRRQVPPSGPTSGRWVQVVDDLNPQNPSLPVQFLRIDLYAYLQPGAVLFDDVVLKAVGSATRQAQDEALDRPATRP